MKLKKGDKVMVIAGKNRGESGAIVRAFPKENKVLIDGINVVKRHRRATRQGGKGQIVEQPMPIHASNVQLLDPKSGKPTRIKIVRTKDGGRERVAVKSGETLK
ncbi:MAG: 50S ribosomal protein L24 [Patescibacteria group bacterium]